MTTGLCMEQQLCAAISRAEKEDPIGSAAQHRRYLLLEVPLPWAEQVEDSRYFPASLKELLQRKADEGCRFRFLGFHSEFHPSPGGFKRMIEYRLRDDAVSFDKREFLAPDARIAELAETPLSAEERLPLPAGVWELRTETRDFFVCTHGSHDVCCGKFGYPIYREIGERHVSRADGAVRVWRTSHFGGHRHAPTMIDFPEGRYWAQVEPAMLDTLIWRQGAFASVARHYRGWGAMASLAQAVERELFVRYDWSWISFAKTATTVERDGEDAVVRIDYASPDGAVAGSCEAKVYVGGTVVTGGCGYAAGEARQLSVGDIVHVRSNGAR